MEDIMTVTPKKLVDNLLARMDQEGSETIRYREYLVLKDPETTSGVRFEPVPGDWPPLP